jgi:two-component system, NarL family, response regulator DesR
MGRTDATRIPAGKTHHSELGFAAVAQNLPRILLADDRQEILDAVSCVLDGEGEIVGLAANGEQLLKLVQTKSPDLVVLDLFMPVLNGIETARCLRASSSYSKVLFLTVCEDPDFIDTAISVGALGYVLKSRLVTDLIPAIHVVLKGCVYISPPLLSCQS